MFAAKTIKVKWNEDGSATTLGRLTARNATGAATGVSGEGKFVKQADLSEVTYQVYEKQTDGSYTAVAGEGATLTITDVIIDTPDTSGEIWSIDSIGYNFRHDLPATSFTTGGKIYKVEYKFTFSGGEVTFARYEGKAEKVEQS